jgi:predicted nucleic acid-binding Zn ribbon protein
MPNWRIRRDGPVPLSDSLAQVASGLTKKNLAGFAAVAAAWDAVIGAEIQEHARPLKLEGATLVVAVDAPAWATQVRLLGGAIIRDLNGANNVEVEGIEVVVRKA